MKTKRIYQGIALLAIALATAACQNELKEESSEPKPGEKINMTIRATQGTAPQTRTSYEDKLGVTDIDKIVVRWEGGTAQNAPVENIKVFGYDANNTSSFTPPAEFSSTPSSLSDDGLSIDFTGPVTPAVNYLAVYPAENCALDEGNIYFDFLNQEQNCTTGEELVHLKGYDIMAGQPVAGGTDNFKFEHQATMLRFHLTLPTAESINNITLTSTDNYLSTGMGAMLVGGGIVFAGYGDVKSISLSIAKHTSSKTLKAYMMTSPCYLSNDELTVTVNTARGNNYEGKLATAGTELKRGLCYTLTPMLALTNTITLPPVTEGKLEDALKDFTPASNQKELVVTGTVSTDDLASLATFLKPNGAGENITTLDLSGLAITNTGTDSEPIITVTGFEDCTTLTDVKLPVEATAIADDAFAGCTKLKNVSQDEPATNTRAIISSRMKTIGARAFKGTAIDVMFLHANITSVGNYAFDGCTALTALVFEGTKSVGSEDANLELGTDIVAHTHADLKIFLPAIKADVTATTYKTDLEKPIYYNFAGYGSATAGDKVNATNYTLLPHGNGIGGLTPGGEWGK